MTKNLTIGKPRKILLLYSLPMLISVIFQQVYTIADSIIAGKYIGENALAAVGASYSLTCVLVAVSIGSNIGCSVVISNLFGAKKLEKMKTAISTSLIVATILSILLMAVGALLAEPIMHLINTPLDIFDDSMTYLYIYIGGFFFLFIYNISTAVFNSLGDSKTPLYFLIVSSLGNIGLDLLFVVTFNYGVAGVAWATFIAQGICGLGILVLLLFRLKKIKTENYERFSWSMLSEIGKVAGPSILQQSFISLGSIYIQSIVNGYGAMNIAGYTSAIKLNTFSITCLTTLANGVSGFTAQNIGAKEEKRVKEGFKSGLITALVLALIFMGAYLIFAEPLSALFMKDKTKEAINTSVCFLLTVSPFYLVIATKLTADGVLRGGGAMREFMVGTFADLILRCVLAYVLSLSFGVNGIWWSWPIGWFISMVISLAFYFHGSWKRVYMAKL